jgi:radical SAM protein with 4Fe4S-binding SPASM domain
MFNKLSKILRYFYNGLSYVLGLEKVVGAPAHIHIETTNICNFRCIYCPQSLPDDHFQIIGHGKMTYDQYKQILDKITKAYKIERIILTRDGEPLVHPDIEKFVLYTSKKGIKTTIGSNGSLISIERARLLIKNGLSIMKGDFCVDKGEYENLRVGAKYEKSLEGYLNILRAAKEFNANFNLVLIDLHTYYLSEPIEINQSLDNLKSLFQGFEDWLSIGKALMHNALGESKESFSSSRKNPSKKRYNLCHHPWLEMVIDYKGNIVGCCRDLRSEYQLGNIFDIKNIDKEIWNGKNMRNLRKNLKRRHPENINICAKCDLPYGISYAGKSIPGKIMKFLRN